MTGNQTELKSILLLTKFSLVKGTSVNHRDQQCAFSLYDKTIPTILFHTKYTPVAYCQGSNGKRAIIRPQFFYRFLYEKDDDNNNVTRRPMTFGESGICMSPESNKA